jgi:hypothetical protein
MRLSQKQRLFSKLISELIIWAYENDMEVTLGDAYRSPRVFGMLGTFKGYGHRSSSHKIRLALDLNLFLDDDYTGVTKDYTALGEKWESMHVLCRWGGHFNDGNHFSFEHNGVK